MSTIRYPTTDAEDLSPEMATSDDQNAACQTWIVIAAYNESTRLRQTLSGLCMHYRNVVVVDDGSRDDTAFVAQEFPVWVLRHPLNCGQGAALQTGLDFALAQGATVLVTFDADGQHSVEEIDNLVVPVASGQFDIALGSRFLGRAPNLPWNRWLVLKLGVLFTRLVSGIRVTDTHNGFRALSREAAQKIRLKQNRMAHASELLDKVQANRLRFREVPVTIHYSAETLSKGQSSWNALPITAQFLLERLVP